MKTPIKFLSFFYVLLFTATSVFSQSKQEESPCYNSSEAYNYSYIAIKTNRNTAIVILTFSNESYTGNFEFKHELPKNYRAKMLTSGNYIGKQIKKDNRFIIYGSSVPNERIQLAFEVKIPRKKRKEKFNVQFEIATFISNKKCSLMASFTI